MALKTINDLTALTTPASTDLIGVWSVSAGRLRKSTLAQVVSQAGVAALLASANTFTAGQSITAPNGTVGLTISLATNAAAANAITLNGGDNLTGPGQRLFIGRNSNSSGNRAAGSLAIANRDGTAYSVWPDAAGLLRIGTSTPLAGTDTSAGGVVGDQTSNAAFKDIVGESVSDVAALTAIVEAAETVKRFTYKSAAYDGQEFSGIVLDGETLMRYGKDATEEYPAGRSLNDVTLFGDLVKAVRHLAARVEALEA